ncbi:MAG: transcriptional coactivator/pterin dehydratase [Acidimicrobiaceae bacterium]|nr:transcriptional coactivator/pterin dehydratase [Acidimicrobiaceae bacterium]
MDILEPARLAEAVAPLAWSHDGNELVKVVRRHDFGDALRYVNEVGALAEAAGHHPDVDIRWNTVTLRLSTHSLGGITDADISLATKIDALH